MSYTKFLARVRADGLARQNRFWVNIGAAPVLIGEDLTLLCKSVNVPGVSFSTAPVRTIGEVIEAPYDRNFSPATLTFYVDRQMIVRRIFDDWVEKIQNSYTRVFGWYNEFIAPQMEIYVDNRQDESIYKMTLYDAHPKSIGGLNLDQGANDIMTFDVTFDYRYYTAVTIEGGVEIGGPQIPQTGTIDYDSFLREEFGFDGVAGI